MTGRGHAVGRRVPPQLLRGLKFQDRVRKEWKTLAPCLPIEQERSVAKQGGRGGRVDVWIEPDQELVVVLEIKATDWDNVLRRRVREYVRRHGLQLHDYLAGADLGDRDVSMHIVYPSAPRDVELRTLVEDGLASMCINRALVGKSVLSPWGVRRRDSWR